MVHFVERCVVSRATLEALAQSSGITVQNPDDPRAGYCGLAAQYFVNNGIFSVEERYMLILVPKSNLTIYTFPHDDTGGILPGPWDARIFEKGRLGSHDDYFLRGIYLPVSTRDLSGQKPRYVVRPRARRSSR